MSNGLYTRLRHNGEEEEVRIADQAMAPVMLISLLTSTILATRPTDRVLSIFLRIDGEDRPLFTADEVGEDALSKLIRSARPGKRL